MKRSRCSALLVLSAVLMLTAYVTVLFTPAQAQDDTDLFLEALPSDAFMYMEVNNIQKHVSRYKNQMYEQMSDEQKKTFNKRKDKLIDRMSKRMEKEAGVNPMDVLPHLTRVQMAVASSKFNVGSANMPVEDASMLFAMQLDRADVFSQMLSGKLAERISKEQEVNSYTVYRVEVPEKTEQAKTPYLLQKGKKVYFSEDKERLAGIAEGPDSSKLPSESLAANEALQSARSGSSAKDLMRGHINVSTFWNQLSNSLNKQQRAMYQMAQDQIGFEAMESVSMKLGMGEGVSSMSASLNLSGDDFPLYDLLFQVDPAKSELLKTIPGDAFYGTVVRLPDYAARLPKIKKKVIEIATAMGQKEDQVKKQWQGAMMMAQKQMNVSVTDLLDQFGDEMAVYITSPESSSASSKQYMKNAVMRVSLDDGAAMESMFQDKIRSSAQYKQMKKLESTEIHKGTKLYSYKTPEGVKPTLFFHNDQLVVAGSKNTAKAVMSGSSGDGVSNQEWFQTLRSEQPKATSSLGFVEYMEYSKFMLAVQEEAGNNPMTGGVPFDQEMIQKIYEAAGGEVGTVSSLSLREDRISSQAAAEIDFSVLDPESVNDLLKDMLEDMKEEKDTENGGGSK